MRVIINFAISILSLSLRALPLVQAWPPTIITRFRLLLLEVEQWVIHQVVHQLCSISSSTSNVNARYNLSKSFLQKKLYCAVRSFPIRGCLFIARSFFYTLKFTILLVVLVVVSSGFFFKPNTRRETPMENFFFCRFRLFLFLFICCSCCWSCTVNASIAWKFILHLHEAFFLLSSFMFHPTQRNQCRKKAKQSK